MTIVLVRAPFRGRLCPRRERQSAPVAGACGRRASDSLRPIQRQKRPGRGSAIIKCAFDSRTTVHKGTPTPVRSTDRNSMRRRRGTSRASVASASARRRSPQFLPRCDVFIVKTCTPDFEFRSLLPSSRLLIRPDGVLRHAEGDERSSPVPPVLQDRRRGSPGNVATGGRFRMSCRNGNPCQKRPAAGGRYAAHSLRWPYGRRGLWSPPRIPASAPASATIWSRLQLPTHGGSHRFAKYFFSHPQPLSFGERPGCTLVRDASEPVGGTRCRDTATKDPCKPLTPGAGSSERNQVTAHVRV